MRLLLMAAALLSVTACGGGRQAGSSPTSGTAESSLAGARPRAVLKELIAAAAAGDDVRMWTTLSRETKRRLGPTLARFRTRSSGTLRRQLAPFAGGVFHVFLEQQVSDSLAVVAISKRHPAAQRKPPAVYAAALFYDARGWRVVLDPALMIKATRPSPNQRIFQRTKILTEIVGAAPVSGAALWLDGLSFDTESASTDPRHFGVLGEAPQPLRSGRHTVVALATAGRSAAARAWTFISYGGPYRKSMAPLFGN